MSRTWAESWPDLLKKRRMAWFRIDFDTLAKALGLPEGVEIRDVGHSERWFGAFEVKVEGLDLPEVPDEEPICEVRPTWEVDEEGRKKFVDWGS